MRSIVIRSVQFSDGMATSFMVSSCKPILAALLVTRGAAPWATHLLLACFAFSAYLSILMSGWIRASRQDHELFIDGDMLYLFTDDGLADKKINQQISLTEVRAAEYFEPQDSANLVLRSDDESVEIPLWSFGPQAEAKIVNYVRARGIKMLGIPNEVI